MIFTSSSLHNQNREQKDTYSGVNNGNIVGTLQTGYLYAQDLSQVPRRQIPHPARERSGITTCPVTSDPLPDAGGLRCRHLSRGSRPASLCRRALASWRVPWHRARLSAGEGSGVATCPTVSDPPPDAGGLWRRHVAHGSRRAMGHKQKGNTQPVYLLGWAHLPPRQARAFLRHLTSGSS
jgi:hypothetical protein